MTFTFRFDAKAKAGDPLFFDVSVTYLESTLPEWFVSKVLHVTIDPALTPAQQRTGLLAQILTDAAKYKAQLAVDVALEQLIGQSVVVP